MAKRQIRIPREMIPGKWSEISGKKVNIVLDNGSVLMVMPQEIKNSVLKVQDMRFGKQMININEISEIIIDY